MKISLKEAYPSLVEEWSDRNDIAPCDVTPGSNRKVWWRGSCGHEWEAIVKNRVHGSGCPYCSGNKILAGVNDLGSLFPDIAAQWSDRNEPERPDQYTASSNQIVWWKASCGHEWRARIADRTEGTGCPYCAGKILAGFNDLATTNPELLEEWSDRNRILPAEISARSRTVVWWKCKTCGYEWEARISTKLKGTQCPCCRRRRSEKSYLAMLDRRKERRADRYGFPSEAFRYYAANACIRLVQNEEQILGLPIQFYLPDRRIAIEFSGRSKGSKQKRRSESIKNDLCLKNRIRMVRILECGDPEYSNCLCITRNNESIEAVSDALGLLFQISDIEADVDVARDMASIREFIAQGWKDESVIGTL